MKKFLLIDFEYNETKKEKLNLVCASYTLMPERIKKTVWLHKLPDTIEAFKKEIAPLMLRRVTLCFNAVAEGSSFYSMGMTPYNYEIIDLFAEYRMLSNHNNRIACGKHLIKGKEIIIPPPKPKWQREEGEKGANKLDHSLAEACYKFLGLKIDTDRKEAMRNLIISCPEDFSLSEKQEIMEYCESDVEHLWPLYQAMLKEAEKVIPKQELPSLHREQLIRGEAMARSAVIERVGYPTDLEAARNFSNSVKMILSDMQRDINSQFPEIWPFEYNKKNGLYTLKQKKLKNWIVKQGLDVNWMRTGSKDLSLALEAWERHFDYRHTFPRGNLGAQVVRFLKTKQNLNGFMPSTGKKTFWDYAGEDGRVRPYINPYGSQASRFQPSATSFLFLKSAWMRSLCVPAPNTMIVGMDFKSEEFLIKAITFLDKAMMKAYRTGDPYLAFAKDSKAVPAGATKKSHPVERQRSKSSILGIQYDMTKIGLAKKLTADTGIPHSEDEAQLFINSFNEAYIDQYLGQKAFVQDYKEAGYAKLMDGWYMFGDNINDRSVGNFPHQGHGAVVLRRAIKYCQDAGLEVVVPLHDALYCVVRLYDWAAVDRMAECMKQAFKDSFPLKYQKYADIFLDCEVWSPQLKEGTFLTEAGNEIKVEKIHKDERAIDEYERFKKYFFQPDFNLI